MTGNLRATSRSVPTNAAGNEELARWDEWHAARTELENAGAIPLLAPWRELALARLPTDLTGSKVLDVGCARGGFARLLADRGASLTAVDGSSVARELTRRRLENRAAEVVDADVRSLPFADETFDVTTCLQTASHVRPAARVLREAARVTRRGGLLVVTVENHVSLLGLSKLIRRLARREGELPPVTVRTTLVGTLHVLRAAGCRIEAVDGTLHLVELPGLRSTEVAWLERVGGARFFAFQSCVAARRVAVRGPAARRRSGDAVARKTFV